MNKQRITLLLCVITGAVQAAEFQLLKVRDEPYSHITYICDNQGRDYVVKQIKNEGLEQQFLLVLDCLGAFIAQRLSIACNTVEIIPPGTCYVGKQSNKLPATVHSLAPGIMLDEYEGPFGDLHLQQHIRPLGGWLWKKIGALPVIRKGLCKELICHMARHPQLPALVALDTFTGNNDRSELNLFYDKTTDSFCGIDMGQAYKQNLCKEAVCQLLRFHHEGYVFTVEEQEALQSYAHTLNTLIKTCQPKFLIKKLHEFAQQAGFNCDKPSIKLEYIIKFYEDMITECYHDAIALAALLELLL